jgi:hypothetical protein
MVRLSSTFIAALKLSPDPAYKIAQMAQVDPATLSKLIHGIIPVSPDDDRIRRVAALLGIPMEKVFENRGN